MAMARRRRGRVMAGAGPAQGDGHARERRSDTGASTLAAAGGSVEAAHDWQRAHGALVPEKR